MQIILEAAAYTIAFAALLAGALPLLIWAFNLQAGRKGARQR
ncbi:hypothetical protein THIX_60495 [Thiomonas sp. X19]|nr:hypothetical protein [Thiomonas sp. X19]SCC94437.1 hypothetical protein THIX_60495 [Thiomonas sp. X19]